MIEAYNIYSRICILLERTDTILKSSDDTNVSIQSSFFSCSMIDKQEWQFQTLNPTSLEFGMLCGLQSPQKHDKACLFIHTSGSEASDRKYKR